MRCMKSSLLYGGLCHHPNLKTFNLSFSSFLKFLSCSISSTLHCLHSFRRCSSLTIYILEFYVLNNVHLLLILQVAFSAKWMWSDPFPLYAKLNPVCSQMLHVRSIWNPFKIFTVSLSAEEFADETLKFSYLNFFGFCRSNRSTSHDKIYLFTHDLTRYPPLCTR